MKHPYAALAASAVMAASLAACSSSGGNTIQPPAPAASAPAATPAAQQSYSAEFGGSVSWPSGVKVTVAKPTVIPAGQYAIGAIGGKIVVFTMTVTNGSKAPLNAAMIGSPKVNYGADGTESKYAIDSEANIGTDHLSTILPGEKQTVKEGFGIPAAGFSDVRVEVTGPEFTDQPAIFKGKVG